MNDYSRSRLKLQSTPEGGGEGTLHKGGRPIHGKGAIQEKGHIQGFTVSNQMTSNSSIF